MLRAVPAAVLLLAALALILPPQIGFADDPGLAVEVKALRAEVKALTARVTALEQNEANRVGMVGIVGIYELDLAAFEKALVEATLDASGPNLDQIEDPEKRAQARANVEETARKQARATKMTLTLSPDGTFEVAMTGEGGDGSARGTWKCEGTTLTLTTSHEDGKAVEEPTVMPGELVGGTLRLRPSDGDGFTFVLRKR